MIDELKKLGEVTRGQLYFQSQKLGWTFLVISLYVYYIWGCYQGLKAVQLVPHEAPWRIALEGNGSQLYSNHIIEQ